MAYGNRQFSLDRFIPRRRNSRLEATFDLLNSSDTIVGCNKLTVIDDSYYVNTAKQKYCKENYKKLLIDAIFSEKNNPMEFSDCAKKQLKETIKEVTHWPVKPRSKPLLPKSPSMMLDLPDLDTHFCRNVVDWGKSGYIGTTYENEVHLWHPEKNIRIRVTDVNENIVENCIKWNADGNQFTMALVGGRVSVYDMQINKSTKTGSCPCKLAPISTSKMCTIISTEWTKSNYLLTGCSDGTLACWSERLMYLRFRYRAHIGDITKIILSCKENYLASTGVDQIIVIWTYPEIRIIKTINCAIPTKAIAWHPWKDSLLVVGDGSCFYLWNVQNMNMIRSIIFPDSYIDSLTFNPLSAELLISLHSFYDDILKEMSYLKVMKNMEQVVDEVRCNQFRIPYLLWNNTGTKLGTASTEETFCIWNFFGRSTPQEKKYLKKERKIFSENGVVNFLGKTIR